MIEHLNMSLSRPEQGRDVKVNKLKKLLILPKQKRG